MKYIFPVFVLFSLILFSCEKKTNTGGGEVVEIDTTIVGVNTPVNKWIWEDMDLYYLWRNLMPDYAKTNQDPFDYFHSLLYSDRDKWSFLTENYKDLVNSFKGIEKAAGYSLALYYKDSRHVDVIGIVEFVYPNTPAARAGIKRGDIITKVNSQVVTVNNYLDLLYYTDDQVLTLSRYEGNSLVELPDNKHVIAEQIVENPVIKDTVYTIGDKKIGYLMYVGFISDFNSSLNSVFNRFKTGGVTDMILDLRYNPGGDLGAANYMCSNIAPVSAVTAKSRLVNFNWNSDLQSYIESQGWTDNLYINMTDTVTNNLNLSKIYVLTTNGTASASELTITGLRPYMDVVCVGDTTHGKYVASITLPNADSTWAMQPIVIQYSNADGFTSFYKGLAPDYLVNDSYAYGIADTNDPMINKAIEAITGISTKSSVIAEHKNSLKYFGRTGRNPRIQEGLLNYDKKGLIKRLNH
ncbi:S41 family peptidase [Saccharicrinis sp. FJH62]|uniref:S41 family peptidase n=1 Tax=Saccharicrinis sp. FJH62 TaxID=3344657 RepID=UPI0035D4ADCE